MRTSEAISPIAAPAVASSLAAFIVVYVIVFGSGLFYLLRLMARDPAAPVERPLADGPLRTAGTAPGPALEAPHA